MKEPIAIIKDGKIVNHEQLKRYWQNEYERRYHNKRSFIEESITGEPLPTIELLERELPFPPKLLGKQTIHLHLDKKALELQERIVALETQFNEHITSKRKRRGRYLNE